MKQSRIFVLRAFAQNLLPVSLWLLVAGAYAETVTIDTAAGTTNRLQQIYAGETDLSINPGATGGVVLPRPYSTYSGTTTLGSGTLVVAAPAREGAPGELGAYGPLVLTGGTLQYSGVQGGVWTRPITNHPASDTAAVVWQIDNDLTVSGDVYQPSGAFIKTGKGTLTLTKPFVLGHNSNSDNRKKLMNLSPDRAPTQGFGPFTAIEGTVVIDVASTNESRLSANDADIVTIGAWTTSEAGKETAAELIQSNGVTRTGGNLTIGNLNGNTVTAPTPLTSAVRIRGGKFYVGKSGTGSLYLGGGSGITGTYRSVPMLEITGTGASQSAYLKCGTVAPGYTAGGSSTILVQNGGYLDFINHSLTFGSNTGNASTTNLVLLTGANSWMRFQNMNNKNSEVSFFRIEDGATAEMYNFINTKGQLHLIVDGGTWRHRNHNSTTPHFPSTMTSVKVGPGGMTTMFNGGAETHPVVWEKGIEPLDDSGTDGGLHITQGKDAMPPLRMNAANTYCGPTEISFTRVYLGKDGRLPSGTALSIYSSNGGLIITNGITQTVGSFTFGRDTTTDSPILGFGPNACLNVAGALHIGDRTSAPKFHLFETQGVTNALATPGSYTFLTAREEDLPQLVKLCGLATFPYKPDEVAYTCTADVSGGLARLRVTVTPADAVPAASGDPLVLNNTVLDETLTATAEQIAAARSIYTNPGYGSNLHGPVDLGALTGFASGGSLVAGNGVTYASDLSFANSVSNITLKFGTLAYTGGDAAIPGVVIESSDNRSSVLNITNENTTLTIGAINAVAGGFTKNGPGTLKLKPPAGTTMTLPSDYENNGSNNGVTAYGDGPANGTRAFNIDDGWVEIGTAGDPSDAPDVFGPFDFSIGSQSCRNGIAEQTAGNLRMNNGSLYVSECLYIGYYCGSYASNPDLNLTPTLEQNGGLINCAKMQIGQSSTSATGNLQTDSPRYFLHGGTNIVRGSMYPAYTLVPKAGTWRTAIEVDGGFLCVSNDFICGNNANSMATDVSITGGRVEVGGTFYPAYNVVRETNTFTLAGSGVLRTGTISGNGLDKGLVATFDGGVFESVLPASGYTYVRYLNRAYIGAGGLNIDLSQHAELETRDNWLVIQQTFDHDPECEGADGGITVRGKGSIALSTGLDGGTFNGGIRATDGARVALVYRNVSPFAVSVAPGCILHDYAGTNMVKDLTLGEAGATVPVTIEQLAGGKFLGFVATNDLQILSPVTFTTIQDAHDFRPALVSGVYTALVYNAANADVDLSLFRLSAEDARLATLAAAQATIADGGEFDGMKAVVLTVTAKNSAGLVNGNAWASVSAGGSWSVGTNWENLAFVPNGSALSAYFNPAAAAGVGVTLDAPVTLGEITFHAASPRNGYALSGADLTLDGGASAAAIVNASGTNTIASAVTLATAAQLQTTAGNELRLTGGVSGDKNLTVNKHVTTGAGQVNLHVSPDYTGKVTTGSGRVVMDDLSFVQSANQLVIGLGTLHYTGPAVELPGITYAGGSERAAIFETDSEVTLNSLPRSGTSAFMKRGAGTLRLHGTGSFSPNTFKNLSLTTGFMSHNGDSPVGTTRGLTVATGTFIQGEVDDPANAPTVSVAANEIAIGSTATQGDATYILNNGTFTDTATFYLGYYSTSNALSPRAVLSYIQNGGTLKVSDNFTCGYTSGKWNERADTRVEINGGHAWIGGQLYMGRNAVADKTTQTSRFTMNGGSFATGGNAHLANAADTARGYIDLNGGAFSVTGILYAAYGKNNDTTLRLNPDATLRCNRFGATASGSTTRFYANGGELRLLGLAANALELPANAFTYLYASTNGLVVNTEEMSFAQVFTNATAVAHDPACGETDGGLTKRGAGTLVLAADNSYLGDTKIEGGVLRISAVNSLASTRTILSGGVLEVAGESAMLKGLGGYGAVSGGSVTITNSIAPCEEDWIYVQGDVTLTDGVKLDLSAFEDGAFSARDRLTVVVSAGTVRAPATLQAIPASKMDGNLVAKTEVVDGVLCVVFSSGGTVIVVR